MENFLIDLHHPTIRVAETQIQVTEGDYKGTIGIVTQITQINEKTGFISFKVKTENGTILAFDNLCAKKIIGKFGFFNYDEIDAWLLNLDRISQEGRKIITEQAFVYKTKFPNYKIIVEEYKDLKGIKLSVLNNNETIAASNFVYATINFPENETTDKFKLSIIDSVIEEVKRDVNSGDVTAIVELLEKVPTKNLLAFLPQDN